MSAGWPLEASEAEQREKYPPNCPRCVVTRTFGLVRCLACAMEALARSEQQRREERR